MVFRTAGSGGALWVQRDSPDFRAHTHLWARTDLCLCQSSPLWHIKKSHNLHMLFLEYVSRNIFRYQQPTSGVTCCAPATMLGLLFKHPTNCQSTVHLLLREIFTQQSWLAPTWWKYSHAVALSCHERSLKKNRMRVDYMHVPWYLRTWSVPSPKSIVGALFDSFGILWTIFIVGTTCMLSCCNWSANCVVA